MTTAATVGIAYTVTLRLQRAVPEIATNIDTLGLEQRVTDTTQLGDAKRITVGSMDATDQQSIKEWIALRQPREMAEMLAFL